ncbi:MAG: methionyl-tRNA formyltransferase [Lachnospiraceae bacterium]|nr:methionyl-tRNA formyltransferase [Lachnospiraceae bacterium]
MKVLFMGTPDFAVGALEAIIQAGHEVVCVVTQPDKPKGRSGQMQFSPVKECALKYGLPVFQPERIKRPEAVEELKKYDAQVFVVAAFGQIVSREILDMPPFGCINIHASLLPKYRGASPIQQAVLDGEEKSGVTIMQMEDGIDTGDILYQKEIRLDAKETGASLFDKLSDLGAQAIVEALPLLEAGKLTAVKQDEAKATHVKMISKSQGLIDWTESAIVIERKIRGLNSWPSAYTYYKGKQLKIWDGDVLDLTTEKDVKPGTVVGVDKHTILVQTGKMVLAINELQLEGKKRMNTHEFLLGYQVKVGEVLGSDKAE